MLRNRRLQDPLVIDKLHLSRLAGLTIIKIHGVSFAQLLKHDNGVCIEAKFESDRVLGLLKRILCRYITVVSHLPRATGASYPSATDQMFFPQHDMSLSASPSRVF
jgi:hypothetical protein